ncbi:MAG: alpha-ketoglutarate-dependent dioxygenase AlkB [Xanthobacteraceae bacterium]|nr:alpha-ketoglutarate-dependent dioxygenase AlkB [Xanthobacteraceae bacterium]
MPGDAQAHPDLFGGLDDLPSGFCYATGLISAPGERALVARMSSLPFKEFEFQGFLGNRRVVSFGWRYDFNGGGFQKIEPMPDFLWPLRDRAAEFAGLEPQALEHALLTEYRPGAAIGWHKDRPVFDDVVGVSLLAPCQFRFRRKAGSKWQRRSLTVEPRSVYLLRGASRTEWQHSIPGVDALRYSVTFRSLKR